MGAGGTAASLRQKGASDTCKEKKLPPLVGKIHGQCFQVIQVARDFSCGNFAHPVTDDT